MNFLKESGAPARLFASAVVRTSAPPYGMSCDGADAGSWVGSGLLVVGVLAGVRGAAA